jgi:hypothetical protein
LGVPIFFVLLYIDAISLTDGGTALEGTLGAMVEYFAEFLRQKQQQVT